MIIEKKPLRFIRFDKRYLRELFETDPSPCLLVRSCERLTVQFGSEWGNRIDKEQDG
jgi:hypothetical protein